MLSLILPPIGAVLCIAFLVWLFFKKRKSIPSFQRRVRISQTITPPEEENVKKEIVKDRYASEKKSLLGFFPDQFIRTLVIWVGNSIQKSILKGKRYTAKKKDVYVSGVSAMMNGDVFRKKGYFGGRPMISDTVTLPQKKQEKDQYEQIFIERISLNPRDVEAYERLGDYYMENGNLDDAKECFKQVLRLSPLSRRARFRMRRIEKNLSKKG